VDVEVGPRLLTHDLALGQHDDAVRHLHHLVEILGDQQDRYTLGAVREQLLVDVLGGADVDDIAAKQWDKSICNVAYRGPCALTGLTVGQLMDDPDVGPISRSAATEASEVARALGIALGFADPVEHVRAFAEGMPDAKPSVLLDVEAGRLSEIGVINGAIPREAEKVGLTAPVDATLTWLVHSLEVQTMQARVDGAVVDGAVDGGADSPCLDGSGDAP
jgi:ketopantoate reductase